MKNGKLSIVLDENRDYTETVRVSFNDRSFEVTGWQHLRVLEQVVSAALRGCLSTVPKDEDKEFKDQPF